MIRLTSNSTTFTGKRAFQDRPYMCSSGCGTEVVFDDNVKSPNGKPIPLEKQTHQPHFCPVKEQKLLEKIQSYIDGLQLKHYSVRLIVETNNVPYGAMK